MSTSLSVPSRPVRGTIPSVRRGARLRRVLAVTGAALALALTPLAASAQNSTPDDVIEPMSLNQCASGRMCVWTGGSYTGSFWGTSSSASIPSTIWAVGSYWNNRSSVVYLYSGRLGMCLDPGERVSLVSGWPREADRVSLSSAGSC